MRHPVGSGRRDPIYSAVWRWHFIAGLLALPFLLNLAVTGALYLFHSELDDLLYRSVLTVPAAAGPALPASILVEKAEQQTGGKIVQITFPAEPTRSLAFAIQTASGQRQTTYLDPFDGTVLGTIAGGGVMAVVRKLHSLEFFGFFANCLIEIAAGWVVVLVLSGLYLWWPRGQRGGIVTLRATPKTRLFWRDLHAVTGLFAGAVILFLAVTGMPWSPIWGKTVQQWTTAAGLGRPSPPIEAAPRRAAGGAAPIRATQHDDHDAPAPADLPWALQQAARPASGPQPPSRPVLGLDRVLAILADHGLEKPFSVALPVGAQGAQGAQGAYVGTFRPNDVERTRTLYIDQFTGASLGDIRFADYGAAAKAIEWGISVHQGQQFGEINRLVMLAGCLALVLLVISAPIMWWKRRPKGALGLPPPAADRHAALGVLGIMAVAGMLFPLVGATLLLGVACEGVVAVVKRLSALREMPSVS